MYSELCDLQKRGLTIVVMAGPWAVVANKARYLRRKEGRYSVVHLEEQYVESTHQELGQAKGRMNEVYLEDQRAEEAD